MRLILASKLRSMAAAYNHRIHLEADDMPSLHLVDVGSGFNGLGYYMYHGGNNPHSLLHSGDAPNTTLQKASFQPAGAQNPMPSMSYGFFCPSWGILTNTSVLSQDAAASHAAESIRS